MVLAQKFWYILLALAALQTPLTTCFVIVGPATTTTGATSQGSQKPVSLNMYKNVKGVIFDVDGTLADSWKLGYDATLAILEKHNIPTISAETYHECTRYATPDRLARHAGLLPGDDQYEQVGQKLAQEFDDLYVGLVSTSTAPFFQGIHELLHSIPSHVMIGALTNAAERYAHAVLETNCPELNPAIESFSGGSLPSNSPVYKRFQSIRGADTVPQPKPAPDGLLQVCQELGVSPAECIYIGDSPSDGSSAENAGMPAIGVLWGSHNEESLKQAPFSKLCRSVEELQSLLPQTGCKVVG